MNIENEYDVEACDNCGVETDEITYVPWTGNTCPDCHDDL